MAWGSGEIVIPDAFDKLAALFDHRDEPGQHARRETPIIGPRSTAGLPQSDFGAKPKFRVVTPLADVDMNGFARVALFRIEVKAITVPAEDFGHGRGAAWLVRAAQAE